MINNNYNNSRMDTIDFKKINSYASSSKYGETTPQYTMDEEEEFANVDDLDDVDELATGNIQPIMQNKTTKKS